MGAPCKIMVPNFRNQDDAQVDIGIYLTSVYQLPGWSSGMIRV